MQQNQFFPHQMQGDLYGLDGGVEMRGGFMRGTVPNGGFVPSVNAVIGGFLARGENISDELRESADLVQRGEFTGDLNELLNQLAREAAPELQRGVTSGMSAFPVRENLESPAIMLNPTETPLRNLLPRVPGAGLATAWKQLTSLGGGWGTGYDQPGGGSATRMFYAESGAPSEYTSTYADKSASYKLLGALGSITGLAMAAGANFMDQLKAERQNVLMNTMLNEELALTYADSTATAAPWGDGSTALAFDGLMKLAATGNGTPSDQVQTSVGALTLNHIDNQLTRLWKRGAKGLYVIMNAQETISLARLLEATGSIRRLEIKDAANASLGFRVAKYIHPVSGEEVDLLTSRFMLAGEMFFAGRKGPKGDNIAEVEVLPQVPVDTAPEKPQQLQGYVVTDLSRNTTSPDVHPFMVSVYEVLKLRSAVHVAKSTGVTAVS